MVKKSGVMAGCEHTDACEMPIASLGSVQLRPWWASSATRKPALSGSSGGTACGACGLIHRTWYDRKIRRVRDLPCGARRIYLEWEIRRVDCRRCGTVKQEKVDWLADNPFYTKRFAFFAGRHCQTMTVTDGAQETHLAWWTIRDLEMEYLRLKIFACMLGPILKTGENHPLTRTKIP